MNYGVKRFVAPAIATIVIIVGHHLLDQRQLQRWHSHETINTYQAELELARTELFHLAAASPVETDKVINFCRRAQLGNREVASACLALGYW